MFQVRIHGRGGQGVVTAAEMLSIAAFEEGKHSQAFPSFGSERMGAPVVAYVRIDEQPIELTEPVLERLGEVADPAAGNPALSYRYAQALLAGQHFDEAREFLAVAASRNPSNPIFSQMLALALERRFSKEEILEAYREAAGKDVTRKLPRFTAACLLLCAVEPFRHRLPAWPEKIEAIIAAAEALFDEREAS